MEEGVPESPDSAQDSGEPDADRSRPLESSRSPVSKRAWSDLPFQAPTKHQLQRSVPSLGVCSLKALS
jgi:hypothetical protein